MSTKGKANEKDGQLTLTSSFAVPGSRDEWPASGTMCSVASGQTFLRAYAVVAGQITSYRPCTITHGMWRLRRDRRQMEPGGHSSRHGSTHILSISCFSSSCPSLMNPCIHRISLSHRAGRSRRTYVIHEIVVLYPRESTAYSADI